MKKYKQNRKLIEIKCDSCNELFQKPVSEYNRNLRYNRRNFCSLKCLGKVNNKHLLKYSNTSGLNSSNRRDDYSPFKYHLKVVKGRSKEYNITLEDLKEQWEKQNGICPYSGINLKLSEHNHIIKDHITSASLDRIDSSKGYLKGNIQFVSRAINFMKNDMSHDETIFLCKKIAEFYK